MRWIKSVKYLSDYKLEVCFDNDEIRLVDLVSHLKGEIFAPLKDLNYFKLVTLNSDIDTIVWPNHADFSPDFLYEIGTAINSSSPQKHHI